jgi:hypothetical protein
MHCAGALTLLQSVGAGTGNAIPSAESHGFESVQLSQISVFRLSTFPRIIPERLNEIRLMPQEAAN